MSIVVSCQRKIVWTEYIAMGGGAVNLQNILYWTWNFQLCIDSFREWNKESNLSQGVWGGAGERGGGGF